MTLRKLPEIEASRPPRVSAFEADPVALDRWNAAIEPRAAAGNTISILDVIGEDPLTGSGVTSKRVSAALRSIGSQDVVVDLNSPGGDFFDGVAIYNMLREHPHKITVRILGMAASAASIIAMAGDEIQIGKAGFVMIHNAWAIVVGNRHDMRAAADALTPFDVAMAAVYADRSGQDEAQIAQWMDAETWFDGEEAIQAGLADGLLPADAVSVDETKAMGASDVKAIRRVDALLAKTGLPRSERRALLAEVKGGKPGAAATVTHDADVQIAAMIGALRETIRN